MDERPDRPTIIAMVALFVLMCGIATVASWTAPTAPEPPAVNAPAIVMVAQFDGQVSCLPGWTLVDAEPVWHIPYFPGRRWATVNATEDELRVAYTRLDGTVDQPRLTAAQGRYAELVRVTCRYTPLAPRTTTGAD